jgi:hypothetical protein
MARPRVKISAPEAPVEAPRLGRLALVVAVCFLLGLLWPLIAGMTFVQRPPGSPAGKPGESELPAIEAEPLPSPGPAEKSEPGDAVRAAASIKSALTSHESVLIEDSLVVSCSDGRPEPIVSCDTPSLVGVIEEPIEKLARCDAAEGASGILSLGLLLDFGRGHVTQVKAGRSTTLSQDKAAALLVCAKDHVVGTPLRGVDHRHGSYWLYYRVRFLPPGSPMDVPPRAAAGEVVSASGQGTIAGKTAVVREGPSRQAKVAARLLYGTRVTVTGRAGEWYRIEHGGNVGWVHGKAIGM